MDIALALLALSGDPVIIDHDCAILRGGLLPLVVPMAAASPQLRAQWLIHHPDADLVDRVAAALNAGLSDEAWRLIRTANVPVEGRLDTTLAPWWTREASRLGIPLHGSWVEIVGDHPPNNLSADATQAIENVRDMFSALPWPRWGGPLILVCGSTAAPSHAPAIQLRPALPVLVLPGRIPVGTTSAEICARLMCDIVLVLSPAPPDGWPAWLRVGLEEVAAAKTRGEGPSPLKMFTVRRHAGLDALTALISAAKPDPLLAEALCAPLVHTRRRENLANFLDMLHHRVPCQDALRLAYDLSLEQLLEER